MNTHTKIALTISAYVLATATIVPLATLSANTHVTPSNPTNMQQVSQTTKTAPSPTDCAYQGNVACADSPETALADDAFNAYAAPLRDSMDYFEIQDSFVKSYVGSYSTVPNWGADYVSIPSNTRPGVWHAFKISK